MTRLKAGDVNDARADSKDVGKPVVSYACLVKVAGLVCDSAVCPSLIDLKLF